MSINSSKQFSLEGEHWVDFSGQVMLKSVPIGVDILVTSKNSDMNTNTTNQGKRNHFSKLIRVYFKVISLKQPIAEKWNTKNTSHQPLSFDQHNQGAFRYICPIIKRKYSTQGRMQAL